MDATQLQIAKVLLAVGTPEQKADTMATLAGDTRISRKRLTELLVCKSKLESCAELVAWIRGQQRLFLNLKERFTSDRFRECADRLEAILEGEA